MLIGLRLPPPVAAQSIVAPGVKGLWGGQRDHREQAFGRERNKLPLGARCAQITLMVRPYTRNAGDVILCAKPASGALADRRAR